MTRPSKYDVMRRNRRKLTKVAAEREADAVWERQRERMQAKREESGQTTTDWLESARDEVREQGKSEPEPGTVRVLLHMLRSLPRAVLSRSA